VSPAVELVLDRLRAHDCDPRQSGDQWQAKCPCHDDRRASLSIGDGDRGAVLFCHAGCTVEDVVGVLGIDMSDLFDDQGGVGGATPPNNRATAQQGQQGCTVQGFAKAKKLDAEMLRKLGISDYKDTRWPNRILRIPYRDADGNEPAVRLRPAVSGEHLWRKGSKPCLFGLWRLGELQGCAVDGGDRTPPTPEIILVEGESDTLTLWQHDIPALGLPGANGWRESRDAEHLKDFARVFVLIEPDQGGEAVLGWLAQSSIRDRAWLIELDGFKDASELHVDDPNKFGERWAAAVERAEPWRERAARIEDAERREVAQTCRDLANDPHILDRLVEDAALAGVTGEERTVRLVYLGITSRLLAKPISGLVVKGQSSSGKSYVTQQVARFFPGSAIYEMTSASEMALIYDDEPLAHRVLVVYEASGLASDKFSYIIRSLLSEGKLRYPTVIKKSGELKTVVIERPGPTSLLTTTTALRLHAENETRLLSLSSDESAEQTAGVLRMLAEEDREEVDLSPWHALQRWLELGDNKVTIPFAPRLADLVPTVAVRLRRDFGQVLALVRSHALLHQASRDRDHQGRIVATVEDYAVVRELLADLVAEGVGKTVKPEVREIVGEVRELVGGEVKHVTNSDLAKATGLDKSTVSRRVRQALDHGYLVNQEQTRGRAHRLVPGDPLPDDVTVLPLPEALTEEPAR
jgi:hypothetical protein